MKYARYALIPALSIIATLAILWGGAWMWVGFACSVAIALGGDAWLARDLDDPHYARTWILDLLLYANLPLLWAMSAAYAWALAGPDPAGLAGWVEGWSGLDLAARDARDAPLDLIGGALGLGLFYGVAGTNVGHELTHRTWDPKALTVGRALLALTADASFSIEHVHGHHVHVCTPRDPASARRGESAWRFLVRSTLGGWASAWRLEAARLEASGRAVWGPRNLVVRGWAFWLAYVGAFALIAGPLGAAAYIAISIYGKGWLEFVNCIEHYGLVRVPGAPVEPRHSWNCTHRVSASMLFNLTRHSHHHARAEVPFWGLRALPEAPTLPLGYMAMIVVAAVPPLFRRVMAHPLANWEERWASDEERALLGVPARTTTAPAPSIDLGAPSAPAARRGAARLARVLGTDLAFPIPAGRTILDAALDAGVALPHNCRAGGCGACRIRVVSGATRARLDASYALGAQAERGYVLACQTEARSDLALDAEGAIAAATGATVRSVRALGPDLCELAIEPDVPYAFRAGQHAPLSVPGLVDRARLYSFARGGAPGGALRFLIARRPGGVLSTWALERAREGDRVSIGPARGAFRLAPGRGPLLLVGAGSGVAPLFALLEEARRAGRAAHLIVCERYAPGPLYAAELDALIGEWDAPLRVERFVTDAPEGARLPADARRGRLTAHAEHLARVAGAPGTTAYVCGTGAFVDDVTRALLGAGLALDAIRRDAFTSSAADALGSPTL